MDPKTIYLNIACGDSYVEDSVWINLDYNHIDAKVKKCNLLDRLPFEDHSIDIIYSSHFFEHIPCNKVMTFLNECNRILKKDGIIRLVMPDFHEMCSEYIELRAKSETQKANFLMLEIIDQCVRNTRGGELGKYYSQLDPEDVELNQYIQTRTGHIIQNSHNQKNFKSFSDIFKIILKKIELLYCKIITQLLPRAFREQNVSFTEVGERHMWLYDFESVKALLEKAHFGDTCKMSATISNIANFSFFPLDLTSDGSPRKGKESMYIEAKKV